MKNNCQIFAIAFKWIMPICSMNCQCTESTGNIVLVHSAEPPRKVGFLRWSFPLDLDVGFAGRRHSAGMGALPELGGPPPWERPRFASWRPGYSKVIRPAH